MSNSLFWALGNVTLATAIFAALSTVRFSGIGISLLKVVSLGLLGTLVLSIRDVLTNGTRVRGAIAILLCLPVLAFFGLLTVWEGPLYVSATGSTLPHFQIDGAAGFYGLQIYSPEHSKAEWRDDDIGLIWRFAWQGGQKFPPMRLRFAYGTVPTGYAQTGPAPALNPTVAYNVIVQPAMGVPEYFTLHGAVLTKAEDEYGAGVCWGPLSVSGRSNPAYVRLDCETKQFLKMSERGYQRLRAFQEGRLAEY